MSCHEDESLRLTNNPIMVSDIKRDNCKLDGIIQLLVTEYARTCIQPTVIVRYSCRLFIAYTWCEHTIFQRIWNKLEKLPMVLTNTLATRLFLIHPNHIWCYIKQSIRIGQFVSYFCFCIFYFFTLRQKCSQLKDNEQTKQIQLGWMAMPFYMLTNPFVYARQITELLHSK